MSLTLLDDLGPIGLWSRATEDCSPGEARALARAYQEAGFGCVWLPEGLGLEALTHASLVLHATTTLSVATGIASIWARDAFASHAGTRLLRAAHGDRFLLGLGVSHRLVVSNLRGHAYARPRAAMEDYLQRLESLDVSIAPSGPRVIAGLGPRMLDLAREHETGVLTYLTTAEHTAEARERLGAGHLSAELPVVIGDAAAARGVARGHLAKYLALENYQASFRRLGFGDADLADGGSDRLLEALVVCGTIEDVRRAIQVRRDAGADHVAVQALDGATLTSLLDATASALA